MPSRCSRQIPNADSFLERGAGAGHRITRALEVVADDGSMYGKARCPTRRHTVGAMGHLRRQAKAVATAVQVQMILVLRMPK